MGCSAPRQRGRQSSRNGKEQTMISARRVVLYGLLAGFGTLLVTSLPDVRRYVKMMLM